MIHKSLAVGIVFLFIITSVTPMVIGYTSDEYVSSESEELLDNLAFMCYDESSSNAKYEYYKEQFIKEYSNDEVEIVEPVEKMISGGLPLPFTTGPMDSPWPMFCHDRRHTGRSSYNVTGKYLLEKWKIKLDGMVTFHSPIIDRDGIIYICCNAPISNGTLHAIYPNGTIKWTYIAPRTGWNSTWIKQISPAIAEDGTIYIGDNYGDLHAINPDGTLKWKTRLKKHIISSPVIADDGTIIMGADNKLFAVNPNGTIKWQYTTYYAIRATPAVDDNNIVYVTSHDGYLYAIHQNNGTLRWKIQIAGSIDCYSSPAIDDNGIIYVGTRYDFYAINPNGTVRWMHDGGGCYYGGPTIGYDGTIYVGGGTGLWAFTPNGEVSWYIQIGSDESSPAIAKNGVILMGGGDGNGLLYLISPEGENLSYYVVTGNKEYWYCHLLSSPAIDEDGIIYIGSWFGDEGLDDGYLHAIEVKEHAPDLKIDVSFKFARLKLVFSNVGDIEARNVSWKINVEIPQPWRPGRTKKIIDSGTFQQLDAGDSKSRVVWPIFGLGFIWMKIKVQATDANPDIFPKESGKLWYLVGPFIFPQ